jgi:hypothetical protein
MLTVAQCSYSLCCPTSRLCDLLSLYALPFPPLSIPPPLPSLCILPLSFPSLYLLPSPLFSSPLFSPPLLFPPLLFSLLLQAMIVHHTCALQMFHARMHREKHALRRRRSLVAERAISLAGVSSRPLGFDNAGRGESERQHCILLYSNRLLLVHHLLHTSDALFLFLFHHTEYWRFPTSDHLFIR